MYDFVTIVITVAAVVFILLMTIRIYNWQIRIYTPTRNLNGLTAIVTGANSGIGKATTKKLCELGARVIMACRSVDKAQLVAGEIWEDIPQANIAVKRLQLDYFQSVVNFCKDIIANETNVDILVNNAGVAGLPKQFDKDGLEYTFKCNHLGHFLLTLLLLDKILQSDYRRIIIVSSGMYFFGKVEFDHLNNLVHQGGWLEYNNTKLMNCLFARELHQRYQCKGLHVFTIRPGLVGTNIFQNTRSRWNIMKLLTPEWFWHFISQTPEQGCQSIIYCACVEDPENYNGLLIYQCKTKKWSNVAKNEALAKKLWDFCLEKTQDYLVASN